MFCMIQYHYFSYNPTMYIVILTKAAQKPMKIIYTSPTIRWVYTAPLFHYEIIHHMICEKD